MKIFVLVLAMAVAVSAAPQLDEPIRKNFHDVSATADLGDLPDGYKSSSYEVKVINGSRVEVNRTITKNNVDDGVVITQVLIKITSKSGQTNGRSSEGDEAMKTFNPADSFGYLGLLPSSILDHHRRGLVEWIKNSVSPFNRNSIAGRPTVFNDNYVHRSPSTEGADQPEGSSKSKPESERDTDSTLENRNAITYTGDTDVNFLGVRPRSNPDAEVFDSNLVEEEANRFFARRPQPMRSQPMRSQPLRSQPMVSQPIRSLPLRSQPLRSQHIRLI